MAIRHVFKATIAEVYQKKDPETGVLGAEYVTVVTRAGDSIKFKSEKESFTKLLTDPLALAAGADPREFAFDVLLSVKTEGYGQNAKVSHSLVAKISISEIGVAPEPEAKQAVQRQPASN